MRSMAVAGPVAPRHGISLDLRLVDAILGLCGFRGPETIGFG
jgi:hypothetical protein